MEGRHASQAIGNNCLARQTPSIFDDPRLLEKEYIIMEYDMHDIYGILPVHLHVQSLDAFDALTCSHGQGFYNSLPFMFFCCMCIWTTLHHHLTVHMALNQSGHPQATSNIQIQVFQPRCFTNQAFWVVKNLSINPPSPTCSSSSFFCKKGTVQMCRNEYHMSLTSKTESR